MAKIRFFDLNLPKIFLILNYESGRERCGKQEKSIRQKNQSMTQGFDKDLDL